MVSGKISNVSKFPIVNQCTLHNGIMKRSVDFIFLSDEIPNLSIFIVQTKKTKNVSKFVLSMFLLFMFCRSSQGRRREGEMCRSVFG